MHTREQNPCTILNMSSDVGKTIGIFTRVSTLIKFSGLSRPFYVAFTLIKQFGLFMIIPALMCSNTFSFFL